MIVVSNTSPWQCYLYATDGWSVCPGFIPAGDQIVNKTYMTRVEGEAARLRHHLARFHRKTFCYSKSVEMLAHSIRLLLHYTQVPRGVHSLTYHRLI
jgi:IS1 family transposase